MVRRCALSAKPRVLQVEAAQRRADAAAAALQDERGAHRRVMRHKNRELAEAQVRQNTVSPKLCTLSLFQSKIGTPVLHKHTCVICTRITGQDFYDDYNRLGLGGAQGRKCTCVQHTLEDR